MEIMGATMPIPEWTGIGSGNILYVVSILAFVIACGIIFYVIYMMRLYNRKVIVYENIAGQGFQRTFVDTARLIKLGDGGEELLYLRKKKTYRTAYGKKMGKNEYWFAIGQDGYWYNCVLGDIDAKMGMLDIEPIDRDMRYMHVAVRKNISERYKKVRFMDKYGSWLVGGIVIIILLVGMWFLMDKMAETAAITNDNIKSSTAVVNAAERLLSSLDNIGGGSGIQPATV